MVSAAVLVALAALAVYLSRPAPLPVETTRQTIAVLPFVNISPDPDQEYFSDGLSEELLTVLARNPALRVTSRTSSFSFKGTTTDIDHCRLRAARPAGQRVRSVTRCASPRS
jgi:TolB-like protein